MGALTDNDDAFPLCTKTQTLNPREVAAGLGLFCE